MFHMRHEVTRVLRDPLRFSSKGIAWSAELPRDGNFEAAAAAHLDGQNRLVAIVRVEDVTGSPPRAALWQDADTFETLAEAAAFMRRCAASAATVFGRPFHALIHAIDDGERFLSWAYSDAVRARWAKDDDDE